MIIINIIIIKIIWNTFLKFLPHKRCNLIVFPFAQMSSGIKIQSVQMNQSIW
jgi:hypothetical protein